MHKEKSDSRGLKTITGQVGSGLGKGAYFVLLKHYYKQFKEKLGIEPYPGTLNIRINYTDFQNLIDGQEKVIIEGFESYGAVTAYKVVVNSIDAAVLIPEKTSHGKDIVEIISEINFRERFRLKDGDSIKLGVR